MDFGKIKKNYGEIKIEEWDEIISKSPLLERAPDRRGINPFTNEEMIFSGMGIAYYYESSEKVGNIYLKEGVLLTTGVPISFCYEIAASLNAAVFEDDRS